MSSSTRNTTRATAKHVEAAGGQLVDPGGELGGFRVGQRGDARLRLLDADAERGKLLAHFGALERGGDAAAVGVGGDHRRLRPAGWLQW